MSDGIAERTFISALENGLFGAGGASEDIFLDGRMYRCSLFMLLD